MDLLVLNHVNASTPTGLDAGELAACLRSPRAALARLGHLAAFFELPVHVILAFAAAQGRDVAAVQESYRAVRDLTGERSHELDDWLDYLADASS
jgi:hypothetical protein